MSRLDELGVVLETRIIETRLCSANLRSQAQFRELRIDKNEVTKLVAELLALVEEAEDRP